jgi:hypothetical protein
VIRKEKERRKKHRPRAAIVEEPRTACLWDAESGKQDKAESGEMLRRREKRQCYAAVMYLCDYPD